MSNAPATGDRQTLQQPSNERFKAEMPHIPGVGGAVPKPPGAGGPWLVVAGLLAVLIAIVVAGKILARTRRADTPPVPAAQIDIPAPVPDATLHTPSAADQDSVIALTSDLKPWGAKQFNFRNRLTGETVAALLIRLPTGSPTQASGYWSFAMKPAYGTCQIEYVDDLQKLRTEYGFQQARHPMVGNPCSRSLYDPLKYATLPGGVLGRGAVVHGSDLRPPLGIETKVHGRDIHATRME